MPYVVLRVNEKFDFIHRHSLCVDGDADKDIGEDDEGGDDGGDGKFEYVTSEEKGSSQVQQYLL